ncbi:MAG TPA: exodeoxyribonuclease III [Acidimicrobiia bacterium]|jgi:exodeoxyribonuclease-3
MSVADRGRADDQARERARVARRRAEIEARASMSPTGRAVDRVRIGTWNLNSLRARLPAVERLLDQTHPDVLCLQETKAASLPDATVARFEHHGYRIVAVGTGGYNGVAIATRHAITDVERAGKFGVEVLDREPRLVTCIVGTAPPLRVVSVYVPHGRAVGHWHYEYKLEFLRALADRVRTWTMAGEHVVLAGDLNVAATNSDVFHPDAFVGATHVTQDERTALAQLFDAGLVDVDVECWGARARRFTWWKPGFGYEKNLGMRLDVIAVDPDIAARLETTWIDHRERSAERPSDHAALIADFHLGVR